MPAFAANNKVQLVNLGVATEIFVFIVSFTERFDNDNSFSHISTYTKFTVIHLVLDSLVTEDLSVRKTALSSDY